MTSSKDSRKASTFIAKSQDRHAANGSRSAPQHSTFIGSRMMSFQNSESTVVPSHAFVTSALHAPETDDTVHEHAAPTDPANSQGRAAFHPRDVSMWCGFCTCRQDPRDQYAAVVPAVRLRS